VGVAGSATPRRLAVSREEGKGGAVGGSDGSAVRRENG
jgi:hypothetical protein